MFHIRYFVIPAQAGIQWRLPGKSLDPRLRGDDESNTCNLLLGIGKPDYLIVTDIA